MKKILSNNWSAKLTHNLRAKLICFMIALVIWVALKNQVEKGLFIDEILSGTFTPSE